MFYKMTTNHFIILIVLLYASACTAVKETSKRSMETGVYKVSGNGEKRFYTVVSPDSLLLYPVQKIKGSFKPDTLNQTTIYTKTSATVNYQPVKFVACSFDLDVISILFKYRPGTSGFPRQLNTNFNAAAFLGYRTDYFILSYDKLPLNTLQSRINHFAYSIGGFMGLGAATMNPFVTNSAIQSEYDGVVLTKGVAGLLGIGNFTFGATLGFDRLLDQNRKSWIYQDKPWLGFVVGFNIN